MALSQDSTETWDSSKRHKAVSVLPLVCICKSKAVTERVLEGALQNSHHRWVTAGCATASAHTKSVRWPACRAAGSCLVEGRATLGDGAKGQRQAPLGALRLAAATARPCADGRGALRNLLFYEAVSPAA